MPDEEIINIRMIFALEGFTSALNRLNGLNNALKRLGAGPQAALLGAGPMRLPPMSGASFGGALGQTGNAFRMPPIQSTQALTVIPTILEQSNAEMQRIAFTADQVRFTIGTAFKGDVPQDFIDKIKTIPGISMETLQVFDDIGGAFQEMRVEGNLTGKQFRDIEGQLLQLKQDAKAAGGALDIAFVGTMNKGSANFQQRMAEINKTISRFKMQNFMLQMGTLGVMFSFMSVIAMLRGMVTSLTSQVGDIGGMFKNVAMGMAFVKDPKIKAGMRELLGNPKQMIDAWKNFTGIMSTFNALLMKLAVTIFTDDVIMEKLYRVITVVMDTLSDRTFIDNLLTFIETVISALPGLINDLTMLVGIVAGLSKIPGFEGLVKTFGELFLASVILLPILSAIGWAISIAEATSAVLASSTLATWFAGLTVAIGTASAALDLFFASLGLVTIDAITGAVSLTLAGLIASIVAGLALGLTGIWVMVQSGFTKLLADMGAWFEGAAPQVMNMLKIFTAPFGMLGTLIIDLVTGQFGSIVSDLSNIMLQVFTAALELIQPVIARIPFVGSRWSSQISDTLATLQSMRTMTYTGTYVPRAAGGGFVAETGLAVIHKGETITPANQTGKVIQVDIRNDIGNIGTREEMDAFNASQARQLNYLLVW
jgi:hypothetical protein